VAATLVLDIITNASKAVSGIKSIDSAAGKAGQSVEKSGSKFGGFAKAAGLAVGGAALGGVIKMFKTGVDEQKDFLDGQAQLANGIKSTGNAAHVSVGGLEDLASSIQNYSGQTDDSIVASEKLLLTFTGVRNEAGKNNDIFNQATKMTADMAAKMGGDASKYAVQLGKALNDPAKGVSKLTKIGVTFTDAQKKQIAAMQKAGDTVGAQKVIMGELRKEFGGSAKAAGQTLPGQMKRAQRSFEDVSQGVVASFMPAITAAADLLTNTLLPAFQAVIGWMTSHKGVVLGFAAAIGAVYAAIKVGQASAKLQAAGGLVSWIKQTNLAAGATKIWAGVQAAFNAIMDANPIVLIIIGIVALVAAIVIAYKKSETFRNIVQAAFRAIAGAAKAMLGVLKTVFKGLVAAFKAVWDVVKAGAKLYYTFFVKPWIVAVQTVVGWVRRLPGWVGSAFNAVVSAVKTALSVLYDIIVGPYVLAWRWISGTLVPLLKSALNAVPAAIGRAVSAITGIVKAPFQAAWQWISGTLVPAVKGSFNAVGTAIRSGIANVTAVIKAPFQAAWDWIRTTLIPAIKGAWSGIAGAIGRGLSAVTNAITAPFRSAWDWIRDHVVTPLRNAFTGMASAIGRALSGVAAAIEAPFKSAWSYISRYVISPLKTGFDKVIGGMKSTWNAFARVWNNIQLKVPGVKIPLGPHIGGFTIGLPDLPMFATGAYVTRATAAIVGDRGSEFVAPEPMLRQVIRDELGRAGGNVYNFQIPPTANPAEVGRAVIKMIQAYERAAGAGWRSA
jgi:hypothetical protein